MTFRVAQRIENLPNYPFVAIAARVNQLKAEGKDIIRLDMGSPDLPPPPAVRDMAASKIHEETVHGYTGYRGIPEFREAVARYYKIQFNVDLDPNTEVLPLLGSKEGLVNMTLALVNTGDTVLVPSLSYPTYSMGTKLAEGNIHIMELTEENNYFPDLDSIPEDVAANARILWLNYPHNPTGVLASVDDYARTLEFCQKYDIMLASDNPYFAVMFDGEAPVSALQVPGAKDHIVEFMSLSKSHNMAGWRIGACVGKAEAIAALLKVKSNVDSGHFRPVYEAGVCALDTTSQEWTDERNEKYRRRRDLLIEATPRMGLEVRTVPKGAIYLWAAVNSGDDVAFCKGALEEASVSIVPGSIYGPSGNGYVRIGLTTNLERMSEAVQRVVSWAEKTQPLQVP